MGDLRKALFFVGSYVDAHERVDAYNAAVIRLMKGALRNGYLPEDIHFLFGPSSVTAQTYPVPDGTTGVMRFAECTPERLDRLLSSIDEDIAAAKASGRKASLLLAYFGEVNCLDRELVLREGKPYGIDRLLKRLDAIDCPQVIVLDCCWAGPLGRYLVTASPEAGATPPRPKGALTDPVPACRQNRVVLAATERTPASGARIMDTYAAAVDDDMTQPPGTKQVLLRSAFLDNLLDIDDIAGRMPLKTLLENVRPLAQREATENRWSFDRQVPDLVSLDGRAETWTLWNFG
jgi:hypothetical protein